MVKNLLITGGAGFIGSNFIRHVLREHLDWEVVNLDKLTYAGNLMNLEDVADNSRYKFVKGDIADPALVDRLFAKETFDAVVNFAAESHVDRSILDASPFIDANIKGTQVLLELARSHWGCGPDSAKNQEQRADHRFIQISTDEVYGSLGEEGVFTEGSRLLPNSPYAATKAAADMLSRAYHKAYGLPIIITRSSNNYGSNQFPEKLVPLMIRNALNGKELPVYGEGQQIRDWLHVEDNCRAIDLVLRDGRIGEVYNIGGGCEKKNIDVVKQICSIMQRKLEQSAELPTHVSRLSDLITFIADPRGAAHDFRYALTCSKITRELGWKPEREFEKGLEQTIEWYLENQDWVGTVISGEYQAYYEKLYGA